MRSCYNLKIFRGKKISKYEEKIKQKALKKQRDLTIKVNSKGGDKDG